MKYKHFATNLLSSTGLAQLVEHGAFNPRVVGSSPTFGNLIIFLHIKFILIVFLLIFNISIFLSKY